MQKTVKFCLLVAAFWGYATLSAAEVDTSDLSRRCANLTEQQKQLAKASGYDIEKLCAQLKTSDAKKQKKKELRQERPGFQQPYQNGSLQPRQFDNLNFNQQDLLGLSEQFEPPSQTEEGELEKYGYNLFAGTPTTFAPVTEIPVPVDYVLGVGDTLQIQMMGKLDNNYELPINRDGSIAFPELGPINLAGLKFSDAQALIQQKVASQMIGVQVHVTLGELRSIRVFVLGEAHVPGSYIVSSLSTMLNAIFVSGGVTDIASLRNIQLKRNGKLVTRLDLYDLLQKGDTTDDRTLEPGDVIFIPTAKRTVAVEGAVNRPAIYEIKQGEDLSDLIRIAGGLSAQAFAKSSYIERNNKSGFRTIIDLDLSEKSTLSQTIQSGDKLVVGSTIEDFDNIISLIGHFHRPRQMDWFDGIKVSNVIKSIAEFKHNPELGIALIIRREMPLRKISVLHFNIEKMLANPGGKNDLLLQPLDEIIVMSASAGFDKESIEELKESLISEIDLGEESKVKLAIEEDPEVDIDALLDAELLFRASEERDKIFEPIVKLISQQASNGELAQLVEIKGNVRYPGIYPKSKLMTIKDLVLLAGGLKEASYFGNVEVTRRDLSNLEKATVKHINTNLTEQLNEKSKFYLQAKDKVSIYLTPEYSEELTITLEGQIKFPGVYEFKQGEMLTQVIQRAGGFTESSSVNAAIFTREDLRLQEEKQLKDLRERLKRDIVASELEEKAAGKSSSVGQGKQLLSALGEIEAVGRLVINLEKILTGQITDVRLKAGDKLIIPAFRQEVSVLGEVQHATSHLYNKEWVLDDYLENSGGITKRADDERIYVVRANGSVFLPNQGGWLTHQNEMIERGDTIVVPQDTDRIKSLTLWTSVSQIVGQLALGAAALNQLAN